MHIGDLLVQDGALTAEQRDIALERQHRSPEKRFGEVLSQLGFVSMEALYTSLASKLGVPLVDVSCFDIDPNALRALPEEMLRAQHVLPLCFTNGSLVVAMPDVLDTSVVDRLRFRAGCTVTPVLARPDEIDAAIVSYFGARSSGEDINDIATTLASEIRAETTQQVESISESDNTLVRLVNKMITDAYGSGASDIHVECDSGRSNVKVRFRNDGELSEYLHLPYNFRSALVSRLKIMAEMDISEHRRTQDGRINFRNFGSIDLELRVVVYPTREGLEDIVLRLLAAKNPMPLERLGMPEMALAGLKQLVEKPHGLILAVGPTGSGKTTTLHSLISLINKPGVKIVTAENPIEISQPGLRQVQVNPKAGLDFANIMRAFLRADPDVIMVGEMRDRETAGIAVEASLTGHLVLSTLHTNSAAETVVRLLDMGIDPFSFTDSLLGIVAQRLARKLCLACRTSRPAMPDEIAALAADYCYGTDLQPQSLIAEWHAQFGDEIKTYTASGCDACRRTGYKGRVGLYELLAVTPEMRQLMLKRVAAAELQQLAIRGGMRTLKQEGIAKCLLGVTDLREVHAVAM